MAQISLRMRRLIRDYCPFKDGGQVPCEYGVNLRFSHIHKDPFSFGMVSITNSYSEPFEGIICNAE